MIPKHVAIIVDGNGRWATNRGLKRSAGHKEGSKNLKKVIEHIFKKGTDIVSLYVFSTENFKRSEEEVNSIMNLFIKAFNTEFKDFKKNNIKVVFSGRSSNLSDTVLKAMKQIENETKDNTLKTVNFCLNYGSHYEIIDAVNNIINDKIEKIDTTIFESYLYQQLPNIDLLIRTGGEVRLSNFMLWQLSYAEMHFSNTLFPDLKLSEVDKIFDNFKNRDRRFGGINYKEGVKK